MYEGKAGYAKQLPGCESRAQGHHVGIHGQTEMNAATARRCRMDFL